MSAPPSCVSWPRRGAPPKKIFTTAVLTSAYGWVLRQDSSCRARRDVASRIAASLAMWRS
eukprot:551985-Pyramimonas_sp.AAC.1